MSDVEFLLLAFQHIGLLAILMVCGCIFLYFATAKPGFALADPLHFFYAFTFGTSYGVITLLAIEDRLSLGAITLIFGYGALFLFGLWFGQFLPFRSLFRKSYPLNSSAERTSLAFKRALFLSALLVSIYFFIVGSPFSVESRFEANRGVGFIPRLLDPLRLIISGLLYAVVQRKSAFLKFLAFTYIVILSLASGAKFALLESAYAVWVTSQLMKPKFLKLENTSKLKKFFLYFVVVVIATIFVLLFLNFGSQAREAEQYGRAATIEGIPLPVELLVLRIIANADMYYLGLPDDTFFQAISIHNPLAQFFGPLVGDGVMRKIFNYPLSDSEIGRQLWLYWYPGDPIMRGPTNHFDLVAYTHFGSLGGVVFCFFLGGSIGLLRRSMLKCHSLPGWKAAILSALYLRALVSLLSPSLSLAYLIDLLVVSFLLTCKPIFSRNKLMSK